MSDDDKRTYRSAAWFGKHDKDGFIHRSWMRNQGLPADVFDGRPVIGICNTWSELTPCNAHFRELAEHVKRGVWEAGGLPLEFPVMSLGESNLRPTAMLFRNLASMDVEESIRANPIDGVVLLCGCDKTTPALVMGAASCDLPAIVVSGGPMLNGKFCGQDIGSGTDVWRFSEEVQGRHDEPRAVHGRRSRHVALGRPLHDDGHGLDDGVDGRGAGPGLARQRGASRRSTRAATRSPTSPAAASSSWSSEDVRISQILTREAFENAIRVNGAIGGSTNAVIHLLAIAGRVGVPLSLDDWDDLGRDVPTLVDLMPSGRFLMEDFYYAGGLPAVIRTLGEARPAQPRRADGQRQDDLGELPGRAELERRGDPAARHGRWRRAAASPCCAATSRRTARCSSRRPRRRS